jgi:phosphoenolpyruvate carboxykinase (ATP)
LTAPNVESGLLDPRSTWTNGRAFDDQADDLAERFHRNFEEFAQGVPGEILAAAPRTLAIEVN